MSDLISREALLKACNKAKSWWIEPSDVVSIIEYQPTAYDVDKVVERLEERKKELSNDLAKDYYGIREYEHRSDEADKAIEIVREGGVE